MTKRSNRKTVAAPQNVAVETAPETIVAETIVAEPVVAEPVAPVVTEPVAPAAPAPVAEAPKVSWEETMKKAQASFSKTGSFREGTNRALLFPLLDREEGLSLSEAATATQTIGHKPRSLSSIHTDLHDIAKITQRKLVRCDKGEVKRYRLATVAPAPVAATEEVK
jgi:hypothetical protein